MHREDFKKFVTEKRSWYQKVGTVFCPILKEHIVFNAKGFYHLRYDGLGKERSVSQQISRMKLLPFSLEIIKYAKKVSEQRTRILKSRKTVTYWSLESPLSRNLKILLILKRIGSGNIAFHSILKKKEKTKKPSGDR